MKIPKYIDEALRKRTSCACKLLTYDEIVTDFIDKYHIDVNSEDYGGGCEIFRMIYLIYLRVTVMTMRIARGTGI